MIKFRQISCGSDCTGPYEVTISKPMTVRTFVDELLTNHSSEWGYIYIDSNSNELEVGYGYRQGELRAEILDKYLDAEIKEVSGCGGWTRGDFTLYI